MTKRVDSLLQLSILFNNILYLMKKKIPGCLNLHSAGCRYSENSSKKTQFFKFEKVTSFSKISFIYSRTKLSNFKAIFFMTLIVAFPTEYSSHNLVALSTFSKRKTFGEGYHKSFEVSD